jgi:hypothetical protein
MNAKDVTLIAFRTMGGFLLYFALGVLSMGVFALAGGSVRLPRPAVPLAFCIRLVGTTVVFAVTGLGLFGLRKWAALLFSMATLYVAFWAVKDALHPTPIPSDWNWLGFLYAALLIVPPILTLKYWRMLTWRRTRN